MPDYPGQGVRMSLNGRIEPNPGEVAGLWKNVLQRVDRIHCGHLAMKGDGSQYFPGVKKWTTADIEANRSSYYGKNPIPNRPGVTKSYYDRLFHIDHGYNSKIHRDDRTPIHTTGMRFREEESMRKVPLLSSSVYGHRLHKPVEMFERKLVRVDHILKGFYYNRGTGLPPIAN